MTTSSPKKDRGGSSKQQLPLPEISAEGFAGEAFRVEDFITQLAAPVLDQPAAAAQGKAQGGQVALSDVKLLLSQFERCEKELAKLQTQVDLKSERLKRELGREEEAYQGQVAQLEVGWDKAQQSFSDLEGRMTSATQAATRIGNRLQSAEQYRVRALDAMERLQYLQEFAHARDPSDLSQLFHQDARMAEAAAMTGKLLAVANELISARERVGLGDAGGAGAAGGGPTQAGVAAAAAAAARCGPPAAPAPGSIENAVEQLELYRNVLENRVVSRFDDALARGELVTMADCADIMAEFSRGEATLVQRYISTRPMFTNLRELQFGAGAPGAAASSHPSQQPGGAVGGAAGLQQQQQQAQQQLAAVGGPAGARPGGAAAEAGAPPDQQAANMAALRGLGTLYKGILGTMREEAVVMEQVFPSPEKALGLFIQRIFEQRVGAALAAALRPPPRDAPPATLQAHLNLLAEAFKKTRQLAADLQEVAGCDVMGQVDAVFSEALADYPALELRWLAALYDAKLKQRAAAAQAAGAGGQASGLSMELVLDFLSMNEEAMARCVTLSPPGQLAANVRQLFHSSTRKAANTGCLLEQVATHVILGLSAAVEAGAKSLLGPFQPAAALQKAAAAAGAGGGAQQPNGTPPAVGLGPQQQQQQRGGSSQPSPYASPTKPTLAAAAAAAAAAAGAGPPSTPPSPPGRQRSRSTMQQAAQVALGDSLGGVLQAVTLVGAIAKAAQQHYQRVILPHVAGSGLEGRACAAGLAALIKAADERVLAALQRTLTLLFNQVDLTLVAEQSRSDFRPSDLDPPLSFDLPTAACTTVTALLAAAAGLAELHLHGANLTAFHGELGRRLLKALHVHMARFSYNPMGALRWKRDVSEYAACCAQHLRLTAGSAVGQQLEELLNSINMLIVAPESLLGLVDGNLRMPHAAALKVISLREDFRSARVGDKSLAAVFAEP